MAAQDDPLDSLLFDYERRKQEDARRQVKRAVRLEEARKRGAEYLHLFAIDAVRDVAARLTEAGHRVMQQEFLDGYPPKCGSTFGRSRVRWTPRSHSGARLSWHGASQSRMRSAY